MAHFVRIRPSGFWVDASVVTPAEWEAFDEGRFKSINGDDGGTWAPLSQIVLGGAGLRVTGPSRLDDATRIDVSGNLNLGSSSLVEQAAGGAAVLYGTVQIKDAAASFEALNGATATVSTGSSLTMATGSSLSIANDALLTVGTHATPAQFSRKILMAGNASIELGPISRVTTTNARPCVLPIPMERPGYFNSAAETYLTGPLDWAMSSSGVVIQHQRGMATEWMIFEVPPLPASATITGFRMYVKPDPTHVDLPAQAPVVRLIRYDGGTGLSATAGRTTVSSVTDPATFGAYVGAHAIEVTGLSESVGAGGGLGARRYRLEVCGEYGANSKDDLVLLCADVFYSTSVLNHQHHETTLS